MEVWQRQTLQFTQWDREGMRGDNRAPACLRVVSCLGFLVQRGSRNGPDHDLEQRSQ